MVKDSLTVDEVMMPSVGEVYAGQKILITGATGFIGKVLVEKLLRSCPSLSRIYLLLRSKRNVSATERWNTVTKQEVFDRLKEEYPEALNKITIIEGDVFKKNLGLSESDRKILEEEVSVIFHSAASVRFNDTMTDAILLNTRGSLELIKLALKMKKIQCFLYVSTTYSNSHLRIPLIEEKVYPSEHNYKTIIKLAETENPADLALMTPKIIGKQPNTYTFSKHMAEQIMSDYANELPIVIVRPSVVINSVQEPVPGWVDNLNGILGVITGISKGVLRVALAEASCSLDYVAVDYAVNSLIVAAWNKMVFQEKLKRALSVYNCAYGNIRKATFKNLIDFGLTEAKENPFKDILWYPSIILTTHSGIYTLLFYMLQLFPAAIIDSYLYLTGSELILMKLNRKIFTASFMLKIFSIQSFEFSNTQLLTLSRTLDKNDQKIFFMNPPEDLTIKRIIKIGYAGLKTYCFHELESNAKECMSYLNKLYWMDRILRVISLSLLLWILHKILNILSQTYLSEYRLHNQLFQ